MLTLFKQIFTWWNHQTLGTRLHTFLKENLLAKMKMVTNTMRVKMDEDGLYIMEKWTQQKYQMNGFLGFILQKIK